MAPDDEIPKAPEPTASGQASPAKAEPHAADDSDAHLSEAARGVIRQSADPRLDAHLARMLSDTDAGAERAPGHASLVAELERMKEELSIARTEADTARRRVTTLIWLFAAAIVAILILLVVVALR